MRLFVAVDVGEAVRERLGALIRELAPLCPGARWVRPEGMHVTLKFIGEVTAEKTERIRAALATIAWPGPIEMVIRNTGFFPNAKHPRVLWAGIEAPPALAALAAAVEARLEPLGVPRESRTFHPHLTLARFKHEAGLAQLQQALARRGQVEFGRVVATAFHLYESRLRPSGAVYTRLATFPQEDTR
ncbi:MAG: RNA 2',3'-cyclic phosphodiesterase [Acidobacteriia bacterium]|jgi:2'-5' RNA ligase|nr:RNA 2',3'-cyclic phosphodiesterase [Terriglobia bacterium]